MTDTPLYFSFSAHVIHNRGYVFPCSNWQLGCFNHNREPCFRCEHIFWRLTVWGLGCGEVQKMRKCVIETHHHILLNWFINQRVITYHIIFMRCCCQICILPLRSRWIFVYGIEKHQFHSFDHRKQLWKYEHNMIYSKHRLETISQYRMVQSIGWNIIPRGKAILVIA